jgi:hypothetical protein
MYIKIILSQSMGLSTFLNNFKLSFLLKFFKELYIYFSFVKMNQRQSEIINSSKSSKTEGWIKAFNQRKCKRQGKKVLQINNEGIK